MNYSSATSLVFILITFTVVLVFFWASYKNKKVLLVLLTYLVIQGLLAFFGFYNAQPLVPAKVPLVVAPSFLLIFYLLFSQKGKAFSQNLSLEILTLLHTIRIPVELILFILFTQKAIPEVMTFEGRNFDILAGITAPILYYLVFYKKMIGRNGLLIWNIICLGLLINIIVHAVLSLEIPIQQFGFNQPNRAILYYPFIWLPSVIVPIVFYSHCVAIQRLLKSNV